MSCVREIVMSLTYTLLVRSERVVGDSWERLNPTIWDVGKQPRDHIAELIQGFWNMINHGPRFELRKKLTFAHDAQPHSVCTVFLCPPFYEQSPSFPAYRSSVFRVTDAGSR